MMATPNFPFVRKLSGEARANSTVTSAHDHCTANFDELSRSVRAGCFYCGNVFSPSEIVEWLLPSAGGVAAEGSAKSTAFCPACGIDAVIGDASGYPIDDKQFLGEMQQAWFSDLSIADSADGGKNVA